MFIVTNTTWKWAPVQHGHSWHLLLQEGQCCISYGYEIISRIWVPLVSYTSRLTCPVKVIHHICLYFMLTFLAKCIFSSKNASSLVISSGLYHIKVSFIPVIVFFRYFNLSDLTVNGMCIWLLHTCNLSILVPLLAITRYASSLRNQKCFNLGYGYLISALLKVVIVWCAHVDEHIPPRFEFWCRSCWSL